MSSCSVSGQDQARQDQAIAAVLSRIDHKLLVMSGKGGVGKSTVAVNTAVFLSKRGYKVGLLDVDLHGPSVAGMLGLTGLPLNIAEGKIQPFIVTDNLKVVTIQGILSNPDDALIWRGPLKIGAIRQFLADTDWGKLDYLVIDSPPGTGDEPLTVAQTIPGCGALIVTTPQEISLADVRKSLRFCQQLAMPIIGIVENMSGFVCPSCGARHDIFKAGGGEKTAAAWSIPFLGSIPLDPAVVAAGDRGISVSEASGPTRAAFETIIANIIAAYGEKEQGEQPMTKIGIPVAGDKLCAHFGHCQHFAIISVADGKITDTDTLKPPPHEPGVIPAWLAAQGVNTVLAGGMGEKAQAIFREKGIKVICGIIPDTPENIVRQYLADSLTTSVNPCSHGDGEGHECHHE